MAWQALQCSTDLWQCSQWWWRGWRVNLVSLFERYLASKCSSHILYFITHIWVYSTYILCIPFFYFSFSLMLLLSRLQLPPAARLVNTLRMRIPFRGFASIFRVFHIELAFGNWASQKLEQHSIILLMVVGIGGNMGTCRECVWGTLSSRERPQISWATLPTTMRTNDDNQ